MPLSRSILRVGLLLALLVLPLWATIDQDGDGVSDIWTALHPSAVPPSADTDGDNQNNQAESLAGTDPTSAVSHFNATPQRDASGNLVLRWMGITGKRYIIESTADLRTWTPATAEHSGAGAEIEVIIRPAGATGTAREFWRVAVSDFDTDADNLNDWEEAQLGTDPTKSDTDDDGLLDRVEFSLGTDPLVADNTGPVWSVAGACLHLRADLGVVADGSGAVGRWIDVSGRGNDAVQSDPARQPSLASGQLNGLPVVHFSGNDQVLYLPDLLDGANAGEIIAVVKVDDKTQGGFEDTNNKLWDFNQNGAGYGKEQAADTVYWHYNTFGLDDADIGSSVPVSLVENYHVFDTASGPEGCAEYFNGRLHNSIPGRAVSFGPVPNLGAGVFVGDFAEIIVFDRVLNDTERDAVGRYLVHKYIGGQVAVPEVPVVTLVQSSGTSVRVSWTQPADETMHTVALVERQIGSGPFTAIAEVPDFTSFNDTGLAVGLTYSYRVRVRSYGGVSDYSTPKSILLDPVLFSGLRIWLKADAGAVPDANGFVRTWLDQSGLGQPATAPDLNRAPKLVTDAIGGKPALRFDGVNDSMSYPSTNPMAGVNAGEVFVVARLQDFTNADNFLLRFGGSSGTDYTTAAVWDDFGTYERGPCAGPSSAVLTQPHIFGSHVHWSLPYYDSTTRFNGLVVARRVRQSIHFGSGAAIGYLFRGDIAEVIVYDHVVSDAEREAIGAYLTAKYAIPSISVPPKPSLRAFVRSSSSVGLEWVAPSGLHTITTIERQLGGGAFPVVGEVQDGNGTTDFGLVAGSTYTYRIKSRSYAGSSPYSDPVTVNLAALPQTVATLQGSQGTAVSGAWLVSGTSLDAQCLRGSVNYSVTASVGGMYALDLSVKDMYAVNPLRAFDLDIAIDGISAGSLSIEASGTVPGAGRLYLPALSAGGHQVTLTWHNGRPGSFLRILSLALVNPSSTDADGNGEADWITDRLARTFQCGPALVQTSVSPCQVEGASAFPAYLKASVTYAADNPVVPVVMTVKEGLSQRFYLDVPLRQGSDATLLVSEASGLRTVQKSIAWKALNLVGLANQQSLVRTGSTLLVQAVDTGTTPPASFDVTVRSPSGQIQITALTPAQVLEVPFLEAGAYIISVTRPGNAAVVAATVTARMGQLDPAPMAIATGYRVWKPQKCPPEAVLESDTSISVGECSPHTTPRSFELVSPGPDGRAVLRLGASGPIMDSTLIRPVRSYNDDKTILDIVDTFADGTQMWMCTVDLDGPISDTLRIQISIYKAGVTFDDGTTSRFITKADLDANGRYRYYLLRPPTIDGATCHGVYLYETSQGDLGIRF